MTPVTSSALSSAGTFQIKGRGTVKVIRLSDIPRGVVLRVGDPVVIDDQDWIIAGVDMVSPRPDDTIGILVRRKSNDRGPETT